VSILPQAWFVSRIADGRVQTLVLAGPGQSPHSYEPTPKQISSLARASAWVLSGAEFEITLRPKIEKLFPALPVIDGTAGVVFRKLEEHEEEGIGDQGKERDQGLGTGDWGFLSEVSEYNTGAISLSEQQPPIPDPRSPIPDPHEIDRHTWLGREPAKILAAHIRDALSGIEPEGAELFAENCRALGEEIDAEFAALRGELAPLEGRNVFVYHPAFGYFLDEFGIRQMAVETGGKSPGPRDLNRLIAAAKQERAAAIFVQAQFPVTAAKTVADAAGAELVSLDPLAPDWLANIRRMGEALKAAIPAGAW
jgi:zinc transport system substrate-binding protein